MHIHTPASFHWKGGKRLSNMSAGERDQAISKLIAAINATDVAAFGIMDYWTCDGYLAVRGYLSEHGDSILEKTIFPGIELRVEAPTDFRMNIHVLFSDLLSPQQLDDFKAALKIRIHGKKRSLSDEALTDLARSLDPSKAKVHGFKDNDLKDPRKLLILGSMTAEVTRDSLTEARETIPSGAALIILPYDTSDGIANIDWKKHGHSANELLQMADIYEVRKPDNVDLFMGRTTDQNAHFIENFRQAMGGDPKPVVSGSDAHRYADYGRFPNDRVTWLKADPTWGGLASVLYEPQERCLVGSRPAQLARVAANRTKYIQSVEIRKVPKSNLLERWFDVDLPLNHGLVSIIGNKGSGKSALTDVIGLIGNSKREKWFPFLSETHFRHPSENKAKSFVAKLSWESGTSETRNLADRSDRQLLETVNYVPQNCFEEICNELASAEESDFDKEIKTVIFSHVSRADRMGMATLNDLLEFRTSEIQQGIDEQRSSLRKLNLEIKTLEQQLAVEHRRRIEQQLNIRRQELIALDHAKPKVVRKPRKSTKSSRDLQGELDALKKGRKTTDKRIQQAKKDQERLAVLIAKGDKVLERFKLLQARFNKFIDDNKEDLKDMGLDVGELAILRLNRGPITEKIKDLEAQKAKVDLLLDPNEESNLVTARASIEAKIVKLRSRLDAPTSKYQVYQEELEKWKANQAEIVGSKSKVDTLKYFEAQLAKLDDIPKLLKERREARLQLSRSIHDEILRLAEIYEELFGPVQEFIHTHPLAEDKFNLIFDVSVISVDFADRLFEWIHHGVTGSFYGVDEAEKLVNDLVARHDFAKHSKTTAFLEIIESLLITDRKTKSPVDIGSQLRKGKSVESLYDFIYGLSYLEPRYILKMDDKELSELSPGEKGTLLLVFYLLIDKSDVPLIIDQPEHNLDNETIYDLLVPAIKEARQKRQIILVTHNPNLAVVCDSDQVVCAAIDKTAGNSVSYTSGAIENPTINRRIVEVLEGTMPAFDNRGRKYTASRLGVTL